MALSVIKTEYKNKKIAFNDKASPIGFRDDIDDLAIMALESNDPSLVKLFKKLPLLSQLKKIKTDEQLKQIRSNKK
ncbi:MAG: hypothetical protein ACJ749_12680 [Flavisolibacter sp.]